MTSRKASRHAVRSDWPHYLCTQQAAFGTYGVGDVLGTIFRLVSSLPSIHSCTKSFPSIEGHLFSVDLALPLLGPLFQIPGHHLALFPPGSVVRWCRQNKQSSPTRL